MVDDFAIMLIIPWTFFCHRHLSQFLIMTRNAVFFITPVAFISFTLYTTWDFFKFFSSKIGLNLSSFNYQITNEAESGKNPKLYKNITYQ